MSIEDQPPPIATDRKPAWEMVIEYVTNNYEDADNDKTATKLLEDMTERDRVGRARYGVPLTSGNGRDALVDAYQEQLDFIVYLRTWLDEQGINPLSPEIAEPTDQRKGSKLDERETTVLTMFAFGVEALLQLRGLIK